MRELNLDVLNWNGGLIGIKNSFDPAEDEQVRVIRNTGKTVLTEVTRESAIHYELYWCKPHFYDLDDVKSLNDREKLREKLFRTFRFADGGIVEVYRDFVIVCEDLNLLEFYASRFNIYSIAPGVPEFY